MAEWPAPMKVIKRPNGQEMTNTLVKSLIYTKLATRVYMSKYLMHKSTSGAHLVYAWAELDLSTS